MEGCRRNDAIASYGRTSYAQQHGLRDRRLAAHLDDPLVFLFKSAAAYQIADDKLGIAAIDDSNLAEHLRYDDLDMLVADDDALRAINLLNFAYQIVMQRLFA